jgi:hypothetical protein
MITMTLTGIPGAHPRVETVVPAADVTAYLRAWKQRPSVVILGGFGADDNSTSVSEVEYRHR